MSAVENTNKVGGQSAQNLIYGKATDQPITLAVIGCGQRGNVSCFRNTLATGNLQHGQTYAQYALDEPEKCKVVAIAEPRPKTQQNFSSAHRVDRTLVFNTWQELHAASAETIKTTGKRLADAVIVSVLDRMHLEVVLAFAEQGYHILCEKPMATSLDDCIKMEAAVKKADIIFGMGHGDLILFSLRVLYSRFNIASPPIFAL